MRVERSDSKNFANLKIDGRAEREMSASACTRSMPDLLLCLIDTAVAELKKLLKSYLPPLPSTQIVTFCVL